MATTPMLAPDGTPGDIPQGRVPDAVKAGFKVGAELTSPDGRPGIVPMDRVHDAINAGFMLKGADPTPPQPNMQTDPGGQIAVPPAGRIPGVATNAERVTPGQAAGGLAAGAVAGGLPFLGPTLARAAKAAWPTAKGAGKAAGTMAATEAAVQGAKKLPLVGPYVSKIPGLDYLPFLLSGMVGHGKEGTGATKLGAEAEVPAELDATGENRPFAGGMDEAPATKSPLPKQLQQPSGPAKQAQEPLPDQPSAQPAPEQTAPVNTQAATPQPSAQPAAPNGKSSIKNDLERLLNQATGGKPLESGVPLKNQGRPQTNLQQQIADSAEPSKQTPKAPLTDLQGQIADAANPLPEGVTPVGSSFLRGYKYDPDKQEFSVFLKNGDYHDFGQVSPEQVKAFLDAKSQGSAFTKEIKNGAGVVPLRKNGKPVNPSTPHSSGDLMPQLQQMLKNATKK